MIPEYVQKIKEWSIPKTGKEVATFLGFAGYYRTFIYTPVFHPDEPVEGDQEGGEVCME